MLGKHTGMEGRGGLWAYLTGAHRHQTPNGDVTYGGGAASPIVAASKERPRELARVKERARWVNGMTGHRRRKGNEKIGDRFASLGMENKNENPNYLTYLYWHSFFYIEYGYNQNHICSSLLILIIKR